MHLLYPSSPLRATQPDEQFANEIEAIREIGLDLSLLSQEKFQDGEFRAIPSIPASAQVLYRGWMLSTTEYQQLVSGVKQSGSEMPISLKDYLATHHLPNWYPCIKDLTPETRVFPLDCDLEAELRGLDWPEYFIKDYVKSLKTSVGSLISKPEEVTAVVAGMRRFRGVIEGGFCVRRVVPFLSHTEQRYFVIDGTPHAATGIPPSIVQECVKRLSARFYSVDVAERSDGELRIVEVGDGQVSDLVGWTPEQFATLLRDLGERIGK